MQFLRNFVILFLCFISAKDCFAQGETSNWYFGENAGIRFNNDGSVTPLNNGRLNTREGCAVISDPFGNLLFYTDGVIVWNRNHQVMEDGTGLYGDPSSSQSAIIVPQPGDPDLYYIFTVDTAINIDDPNRGLNYSVVDITMNNGNGAVIQKNVNLLNRCSEKLSAVVKDCFDGTIWVTTFAGANGDSDIFNTLFSFEVSASGVNTTPVKSNSPVPREDPDRSDPRGYLKISPDGTKMAMANVKDGLYLYDFDVNTGVFSNMQKLAIYTQNKYPYGLEFSQNNQFLYVSTYNDLPINEVNANHQSSLIQFNLSATESSQIILEEFDNLYRSALQLGSNGKIYMTLSEDYNTGTPYLSAINNPDLPGTASGYEHQAINLGSNRATQGLPPFIQSLFNKIDIINGPDATTLSPTSILNLCVGDSYTLVGENIPGATYVWTKNGIPLADTDHEYSLNNVTSEDIGLYELEITTIEGDCPIIGEAAVNVSSFPTPHNTALIQCDTYEDMNDGIAIFNLFDATNAITGGDTSLQVIFYENIDDYNNNLAISTPENYINNTVQTILVNVTNTGGCSSSSLASLDLIVTPTTPVQATIAHYFNCDEDPQDDVLQAYFDFELIRNDFSGLNTEFYSSLNNLSNGSNVLSGILLLENNTTVHVKIKDADGNCMGIETFTLYVDEKPDLPPLQNIPIICLNNPETSITGPQGYDEYSWFYINGNGSEIPVSLAQNPVINQPGNYRLEVSYIYNDFDTSRMCSTSQTFIVSASNIATIAPAPEVNDISNTNPSINSITIFTVGEGDYEFALNNSNGPYQDNNTFENIPSGFHFVHVRDKNGCGTVSVEDIAVIGYPKFFTPNNDGVNDYWNIEGVSELLQQNTEIHIFNRYGKLVTRIIPGTQGWDGTLNGQPLPSTDYWFSAELEDGRNFKGHFTLKR